MNNAKTYSNTPLINPEHGPLPSIRWGTITDISTLPPVMEDEDEDESYAPDLLLQITSKGEIRGVTHDPYECDEYFYVCGDTSDLDFLHSFTNTHPDVTPLLSELMIYRKFKHAQFMLHLVGVRH